jgi:hypothetical protein
LVKPPWLSMLHLCVFPLKFHRPLYIQPLFDY